MLFSLRMAVLLHKWEFKNIEVEFLKVSEKIWSPGLPDIGARKSWDFLILTVSASTVFVWLQDFWDPPLNGRILNCLIMSCCFLNRLIMNHVIKQFQHTLYLHGKVPLLSLIFGHLYVSISSLFILWLQLKSGSIWDLRHQRNYFPSSFELRECFS